MTIGILNPVKSEKMTVISTRENDHPIECSDVVSLASHMNRSRVKKCLFGPVDHDELMEHLKKELGAELERQKRKWGFDFAAGKPLDPPKNYVWERIVEQQSPVFCFNATNDYNDRRIVTNDDDEVEKYESNGSVASSTSCGNERTDEKITKEECSKNCIKYRQTTMKDYWRCTKRSSAECLQCSSEKVKSTVTTDNRIASSTDADDANNDFIEEETVKRSCNDDNNLSLTFYNNKINKSNNTTVSSNFSSSSNKRSSSSSSSIGGHNSNKRFCSRISNSCPS